VLLTHNQLRRAWVISIALLVVACGEDTPQAADGESSTARVDFVFGRGDGRYEASIRDPAMIECMETAGFQYEIQTGPTLDVNSREYAETFGFGLPGGQSTVAEIPADGISPSERERFEQSYLSCQSDANALVEAERARLSSEISPAQMDELSMLLDGTHPQLQALQGDWIECMAEKGFDISSLSHLVSELSSALSAASSEDERLTVVQREKVAAVANYDCSLSSGTTEVVNELFYEIEQTIAVGIGE
jgi:hypothetical protein